MISGVSTAVVCLWLWDRSSPPCVNQSCLTAPHRHWPLTSDPSPDTRHPTGSPESNHYQGRLVDLLQDESCECAGLSRRYFIGYNWKWVCEGQTYVRAIDYCLKPWDHFSTYTIFCLKYIFPQKFWNVQSARIQTPGCWLRLVTT